jgi:uncharacterized protein YprB with RNaseH-like and TPR domain
MRSYDPDEYTPEPDPDYGGRANNVYAFREQLRRDYEGLAFSEVLPGAEFTNDYGPCYRLSAEIRGALRRSDPDALRTSLLGSTSLVRGIRARTGLKLAEKGFHNLADLENHPRFAGESKRIRELLETGDSAELAEVVGARLSRSHPAVLGLSGMHHDSEFLFLDLETMGLFAGQPIVVAGVASLPEENVIRVEQYVVRDLADELGLVAELNRQMAEHPVLVTYNGKAFDVPILSGRCAYYGLRPVEPRVHFDLLHFCRRAWRAELESCSLGSIERAILGTNRDTDLPGEYVPEFYHEYLRTGNAGFLKPIVDHNRQDTASLVNVFSALVELWTERGQ